VFSTVGGIVKEFVRTKFRGGPLAFTADKSEPSRVKLYRRLAPRLADALGMGEVTEEDHYGSLFIILHPKKATVAAGATVTAMLSEADARYRSLERAVQQSPSDDGAFVAWCRQAKRLDMLDTEWYREHMVGSLVWPKWCDKAMGHAARTVTRILANDVHKSLRAAGIEKRVGDTYRNVSHPWFDPPQSVASSQREVVVRFHVWYAATRYTATLEEWADHMVKCLNADRWWGKGIEWRYDDLARSPHDSKHGFSVTFRTDLVDANGVLNLTLVDRILSGRLA
jgi:hypothetical protein